MTRETETSFETRETVESFYVCDRCNATYENMYNLVPISVAPSVDDSTLTPGPIIEVSEYAHLCPECFVSVFDIDVPDEVEEINMEKTQDGLEIRVVKDSILPQFDLELNPIYVFLTVTILTLFLITLLSM